MLGFSQPGRETAVVGFAFQFGDDPANQRAVDVDRGNNSFVRNGFKPRENFMLRL